MNPFTHLLRQRLYETEDRALLDLIWLAEEIEDAVPKYTGPASGGAPIRYACLFLEKRFGLSDARVQRLLELHFNDMMQD